MIRILPAILVFLVLAYLKHRLSPPKDVVGSYLADTSERARMLNRAAKEQHYRERWYRGDPT